MNDFKIELPHTDPFDSDEARLAAYRQLFASAQGQKVLQDMLCRVCYLGDDCYAKEDKATFMSLGRKKVGIELLTLLNHKE